MKELSNVLAVLSSPGHEVLAIAGLRALSSFAQDQEPRAGRLVRAGLSGKWNWYPVAAPSVTLLRAYRYAAGFVHNRLWSRLSVG